MALNPLIPLSGTRPDPINIGQSFTNSLANVEQIRRTRHARDQEDGQNRLLEANAGIAEQSLEKERTINQVRTMAIPASLVVPFLENGDIDGARNSLVEHIGRIEARGGDASHSKRGLALLDQEGGAQELLSNSKQLIGTAQQLGVFESPANAAKSLGQIERELVVSEQGAGTRQQELQLRQEEATRKGVELSSGAQKILDDSQTSSQESSRRAGMFDTLAADIENSESFQGGVAGAFNDFLKDLLGTQDEVSLLKRRFFDLRGSQAVKNLPPGSASDADVALALKGFPPATANKKQIASWARGVAKLEIANQGFQDFKSNLVSTNKNTKGLLQKWRGKVKSEVLDRDITIGELWITAAAENLTIAEVKSRLGVE